MQYFEVKTESCSEWCEGCERYTDLLLDSHFYKLCKECDEKYDNETGYCSLSCYLGHGCDGSC